MVACSFCNAGTLEMISSRRAISHRRLICTLVTLGLTGWFLIVDSKSQAQETPLQAGWTPELLRLAIDKCTNQVFELAFAAYRRRQGLPPPTPDDISAMLKKTAESKDPKVAEIRSTCECTTRAIARRRDPSYFASHPEEMQAEAGELTHSGTECAPHI
jgi:hypothetical protein